MEIVKNKWANLAIGLLLLAVAIVGALVIKDAIDTAKRKKALKPTSPTA